MYCSGHGRRPRPDRQRPTPFLRLAADPLRWRLLRELAQSDRRVGELTGSSAAGRTWSRTTWASSATAGSCRPAQLGRRPRHLLRASISSRCGELLAGAGASLHPGPGARPRPSRAHARRRVARVLFLCTGNSARSQMAEALLEQLSDGAIEAASAGQPPEAAAPQRGAGHARARHRHRAGSHQAPATSSPRSRFDRVITLCDRVREVCPEFPATPSSSTGASPTRPARATTTRDATRVRAHRRRARDPHRLPARQRSTTTTDHGGDRTCTMRLVNVRYMVDDVDARRRLLHQAPRLRAWHERRARVRRRQARQPAAAAQRPASSAGRPMPDGAHARARRLEPHPLHRRRHRRRGRAAPRRRRDVPQRHRQRPRRPPDPARRPLRQRVELFQPAEAGPRPG